MTDHTLHPSVIKQIKDAVKEAMEEFQTDLDDTAVIQVNQERRIRILERAFGRLSERVK